MVAGGFGKYGGAYPRRLLIRLFRRRCNSGNLDPVDHKPPTAAIASAHQHRQLPLDDSTDFSDADRGFLGALTPCVVTAADGRVVWDNDKYSFVPGIYQVRGLDLSNISFVEGDSGLIVIDPLVSTEVAAAALQLYRSHRGD